MAFPPTGRGLLTWRLRKLLFDAKIQFLAESEDEFKEKVAILANRCYIPVVLFQ